MIKAIIFDFAGVIGSEAYWLWVHKNIADIKLRKSYFQELSEKVDKGDITNKEFTELLAEETGASPDKIKEEIFGQLVINNELLVQIKKLKKKYKIALLSNYTFEWLDEILKAHSLSHLFDCIYISSRYRLAKPHPKSFLTVLNQLDVKSNEAVFIDDRQKNVDAAIVLGMVGIVFSSNEKLFNKLSEYGID